MQEFNFDKFMDDMEKRQKQSSQQQEKLKRDEEANQGREFQRRYQETPANRIRYNNELPR
tara:strand:- start:2054 stop:2233 length:180 start_codon:yes stop_codon:yes gene_type:complete